MMKRFKSSNSLNVSVSESHDPLSVPQTLSIHAANLFHSRRTCSSRTDTSASALKVNMLEPKTKTKTKRCVLCTNEQCACHHAHAPRCERMPTG